MKLSSFTLIFAFFLVSSCATYQSKVHEARSFMEMGQYSQAVQKLEKLANSEDGDQLVYLLDYAVAAQLAGDYKTSNSAFIKADKLVEQLDYHSLSRITGSLLTSEEVMQYKGDTFEKIFLNAYLAMNFLNLGQLDEALVEARRMNEKYLKYRREEEKKFKQNIFGKYLSALIWEADNKYDDSYIAYNEAHDLDPSVPYLAQDLIRMAKLSKRESEYVKWKKHFPQIKENSEWFDRSNGQLVIIHQQGWGPRKTYNPANVRFPILSPYRSNVQWSEIEITGKNNKQISGENFRTHVLYDVETAAIQTLADDYSSIAAKRIAGDISKEIAADQVRQKNELLGNLMYIAMHLSDRADLRQWSTLPQKILISKIFLPKGKYEIKIKGLTNGGNVDQENQINQLVEIKPGKIRFLIWRTL